MHCLFHSYICNKYYFLFIDMFIISIYYLQSLLIIFNKIKLCIAIILGIELIYIFYSEWWILLPASLVTLGSSMAVCRGYCMTSSTGSTSLTEYSFCSPCWCIDVFMEWLRWVRCTWWTAAHQRPTLLVVNVCGLPVSGSWSFRAIVWTVLVVGVLLLQARRPGIRCQTVFAIQHWVSTFLGVSWRHTFYEILTRCTERIRDFLRMRYINLHLTLLTLHHYTLLPV